VGFKKKKSFEIRKKKVETITYGVMEDTVKNIKGGDDTGEVR